MSNTAQYHTLRVGDVIQEGDEYKSTSGTWQSAPINGMPILDNSVEWRRPVTCGCQEGMVGPEHCLIHGRKLPTEGGCWFCQLAFAPLLMTTEFDAYVHGKCLIDAMKRERHQETRIMFTEIFMNDGDKLLEVGDKCWGQCFELDNDGRWNPISELEGRTVLPGELVCREVTDSLRDGGKDADSYKLNPGGQRA